jgi:hypothetical protein
MRYRFICFECDNYTSYTNYPSGSSWICPNCGAQDNAIVEVVGKGCQRANIETVLEEAEPIDSSESNYWRSQMHSKGRETDTW